MQLVTDYGREANQGIQKDVIRLVYDGRADTSFFPTSGNKQISIRFCAYFQMAVERREKYAVVCQHGSVVTE